jgi:hypothetical protein
MNRKGERVDATELRVGYVGIGYRLEQAGGVGWSLGSRHTAAVEQHLLYAGDSAVRHTTDSLGVDGDKTVDKVFVRGVGIDFELGRKEMGIGVVGFEGIRRRGLLDGRRSE